MSSYLFAYIILFIFGVFKGHTQVTYFSDGIKNAIKFIIIDILGFSMRLATPTLNSSWWFMSMAVMLIFILPVLIIIIRKLGFLMSLMFFIFTYYTFNFSLMDYHYVVIIAIGLAVNNFYKIILEKLSQNKMNKIIAVIFLFIAILSVYYRNDISSLLYANVIATLLVCTACCLSIIVFKPLELILNYIGMHSTNMWFVHMFICYYYYFRYIFGLKYDVLIYIAIVLSSLVVSICFEKIKIIIKWNKITDILCVRWDVFLNKIKIDT